MTKTKRTQRNKNLSKQKHRTSGLQKIISSISLSLIISMLGSNLALANSGDVSVNGQEIRFSDNFFLEGKAVTIYASASNNSTEKDLLGTVRFFTNGSQIGGDQAVSIFVGKTDDTFISWTPQTYGTHKIAVKIYPWEPEFDNPGNNWIAKEIYVERDTDHDLKPNSSDPDDDNDGVNDQEDHFPLDVSEWVDTDGDGTGDNSDTDDDNDEVPDEFDDLPLDPDETIDTDGDGIGNIADTDDDNDGLSDIQEDNEGSNSLSADSDNDGVNDKDDAFPLNPDESTDTDNDGIGNNTDSDDDNDGIIDLQDDYPLNKGPVIQLNEGETEFVENLMHEFIYDASASFDEDGKVISYIWDIDQKFKKEGSALKHSFETKGKHSISLTITDDNGESRTKNFQVNVLNLRFYYQLVTTLLATLLASLLFFKYITGAKKR